MKPGRLQMRNLLFFRCCCFVFSRNAEGHIHRHLSHSAPADLRLRPGCHPRAGSRRRCLSIHPARVSFGAHLPLLPLRFRICTYPRCPACVFSTFSISEGAHSGIAFDLGCCRLSLFAVLARRASARRNCVRLCARGCSFRVALGCLFRAVQVLTSGEKLKKIYLIARVCVRVSHSLQLELACVCVHASSVEACCSCRFPAMTAADSAPAVDPAPAAEAVDEVKVDEKPAKVTKEKKTKAAKEKKPKEVKAAKAPKAPKPPAAHPSYQAMVVEAISALKERTGSSQYAIAKYLEDKYKTSLPSNFKRTLTIQLRNLTKAEKLVKVKNSFKLSDELKKPSKAAAKPPSAPKAVPAKASKVKVAKKPAAGRVKTKSAGAAGAKSKGPGAKVAKAVKSSKAAKVEPKAAKAVKAKPVRKAAAPAPKKAEAKAAAPAKRAAAPAPPKKPVAGRKPPTVRKMATTPKKAPKSVKSPKARAAKPAAKAKSAKSAEPPAKRAKK